MFVAARTNLPVMCVHIAATKTTKEVARFIGVLPYVDEWVCPASGMADALYAMCYRLSAETVGDSYCDQLQG